MKTLKFLTGFIAWLSLTMVLLFTAIALPTFNPGFYAAEYDKYAIYQGIGMTKEDLMEVTRQLLAYMKGEKDDLVVETHVYGESREFFNQREKDHMIDVKELFQLGFLLRHIGVILFLAAPLLLFFCGVRPTAVITKAILIGNVSFLATFGAIVFLISLDFDRAFTLFHQIFFRNDLWILNPETDLLINIVPLPFFIDIASLVGLIFSGAMALVSVGCIIYQRRQKQVL